jgi:hypothetical protein
MATITIKGRNDNLSKDEATRAIDVYGKHLLGRMYKHIDLEVEFISMRGLWGRCGIIAVHNSKYRDFGIELNSRLCKKNQLLTLAHEMVHIKQFARDEFDDLGNDKFWWKNKIVSNIEYAKQPWEKEAFSKEKELYSLYLNSIGKSAQ